jgi:hypothetical protein
LPREQRNAPRLRVLAGEAKSSRKPIVDRAAAVELREQPQSKARREDQRPAVSRRIPERPRRERQENDVHRQDIEQRWVVDEKQASRKGCTRIGEIERGEVGDCMRASRAGKRHENEEQE